VDYFGTEAFSRCRPYRLSQCRQVHTAFPHDCGKAQNSRLSFTTLTPNLGVVDTGLGYGTSFVLADIPALSKVLMKVWGSATNFYDMWKGRGCLSMCWTCLVWKGTCRGLLRNK